MSFTVWCNVDGCSFEEQVIPDLDAVIDLQDEHRAQRGEAHVLEFERNVEASEGETEDDRRA